MCTVWRENEACERAMTEGPEKWRKCNRSSGQLTRVIGRRGSRQSFNHKDVCAQCRQECGYPRKVTSVRWTVSENVVSKAHKSAMGSVTETKSKSTVGQRESDGYTALVSNSITCDCTSTGLTLKYWSMSMV